MNSNEIKAARIRAGYSTHDCALLLGITDDAYRKKERGLIGFSDSDRIKLASAWGLNACQVNDYFFDGKLPVV